MPQTGQSTQGQQDRFARDAELLRRFVAGRGESAFEEVVRRHGPMVMGVCRRVLSRPEDAFQATFLALAARAHKIRAGVALASWLHRVAVRTARQLRAQTAKLHQIMSGEESDLDSLGTSGAASEQLKLLLDEELDRLPAPYRTAVLLCDYYGHSTKEAAQFLEIPRGTVASRLHRGRKLLRQRLARCGLVVSAGMLATTLAGIGHAATPLSAGLVQNTVRSSLLFLAGQAAGKTAAIGTAAGLAQRILGKMALAKLLAIAAICLIAGSMGVAVPQVAESELFRSQPFSLIDDFEDGDLADGNPATWVVGPPMSDAVHEGIDGNYAIRTGYQTSAYIQEIDDLADVTVRAQFRVLRAGGTFTSAGVLLRRKESGCYLAGIRDTGLLLIVEGLGDGVVARREALQTSLNQMERDVILEFTARGSGMSLTAWHAGDAKPAEPQLTWQDGQHASGTVGIAFGSDGPSAVAFRHFEVTQHLGEQ